MRGLYFGRKGEVFLIQPAAPPGQRFEFAPGASLGLETDDTAAVDYLVEYFGSSLTPSEDPCAWIVEIDTTGETFESMRADRPEQPMTLPWFAFDQWTLELPSWRHGYGRLRADDEERGCAFALEPGRVLLAAGRANPRWRFSSVITVHETIGSQLRERALELHAAAIESDGSAVVVAGPKNAGKTTLSLNLLRSGGLGWLANDRLFAGFEEGVPTIRGVPTPLRLPPEAVAAFPEPAEGLPPEVGRHHIHSFAELAGPPPPEPRPGDELMVNLAQAARGMDVDRPAAARLGCFLFPTVDTSRRGWDLEPLDREQAVAELEANLFGTLARERPPTVFENDTSPEAPAGLVAELAAAAPAWRLTLGEGAYSEPGFAEKLLSEALG
jgi:hypothetical protein